MKTSVQLSCRVIFCFTLAVFFLQSCSSSIRIDKRIYRNGYAVSFNDHKRENLKTVAVINPEKRNCSSVSAANENQAVEMNSVSSEMKLDKMIDKKIIVKKYFTNKKKTIAPLDRKVVQHTKKVAEISSRKVDNDTADLVSSILLIVLIATMILVTTTLTGWLLVLLIAGVAIFLFFSYVFILFIYYEKGG
jgi:hypothetical protein